MFKKFLLERAERKGLKKKSLYDLIAESLPEEQELFVIEQCHGEPLKCPNCDDNFKIMYKSELGGEYALPCDCRQTYYYNIKIEKTTNLMSGFKINVTPRIVEGKSVIVYTDRFAFPKNVVIFPTDKIYFKRDVDGISKKAFNKYIRYIRNNNSCLIGSGFYGLYTSKEDALLGKKLLKECDLIKEGIFNAHTGKHVRDPRKAKVNNGK